MKKSEQSSSEFVVCINNAEYPASLRGLSISCLQFFPHQSTSSGGRILASSLLIQNQKKAKNTGLYTLDNLVRSTDGLGVESLLFPDQTLPFARISILAFGRQRSAVRIIS